jgi:hypothetical protein
VASHQDAVGRHAALAGHFDAVVQVVSSRIEDASGLMLILLSF